MIEQLNHQTLAFGKHFAQTLIKANGIAVETFEKVMDVQLKALEGRLNATAEFVNEAVEVRDLDAARHLLPKSLNLVKDAAEKLYGTQQEVFGIVVKSSEALAGLAKGSLEAANDSVAKVKVAPARAK